MKRCITCEYWLLSSSEPFDSLGFCIRPCLVAENDIALTSPGHSCEHHERHEASTLRPDNVRASTLQVVLAQDYLLALIGRERAEFGSLAWEAFCEDISDIYRRLCPQMQINTHHAFRQFMKRPNTRRVT